MGTARRSFFGSLLRRYREAAGLSQEALAERAQMSVRGLIYLERGRRRPHPHTVHRLAEALALTARPSRPAWPAPSTRKEPPLPPSPPQSARRGICLCPPPR